MVVEKGPAQGEVNKNIKLVSVLLLFCVDTVKKRCSFFLLFYCRESVDFGDGATKSVPDKVL